MKKTVLIYGLLSGFISILLMTVTMLKLDRIGFDDAMIYGYIGIFLSFIPLYIGVMAYNKAHTETPLKFGGALIAALLMCLISCAVYATTWQIESPILFPDFLDKYTVYAHDKLVRSGASGEALKKQAAAIENMRALYKKPVSLWLMTIIEPLPLGLLVSLVAAFRVKWLNRKA
jgi:hypothetical protein